jgi:tetratricopeptide (TPR) repeat protein
MSKFFVAPAFLAAALTLSVFGPSYAASTVTLSGEIQGGPRVSSSLQVELISPTSAGSNDRAYVGPNGSFEFQNLTRGVYEIRVLNSKGTILKRELVTAGDGNNRVTVNVPEQEETSATGGGTVSVHQLRHQVPKKARKELLRATQLTKEGKSREAITALENALRIDPECMEAQNNLGVRYIELRQPDKAAVHFRKALELDATQTDTYVNLGVALMTLGDLEESERSARKALDLDNSHRRGRYVLGMVLAAREVLSPETIQLLHESGKDFPPASLALARLYSRLGWYKLAGTQLTEYLEVSPPEQRVQVEGWLKTLRAQR